MKTQKVRCNFRLLSLLWHSAQLGWQSCQLYAPAALYPQGNSTVLISVGGYVDPRSTESGQKNGLLENSQELYRESNLQPPVSWLLVPILTLILLTWRIWWAPNNASRWQMGFNSPFKGLMPIDRDIQNYKSVQSEGTLWILLGIPP